ncbi:radical SAM protein [Candidatus Omnitrophus magneticus]|uniref:Radical SAM protein n=1 Tax=Candidatus Omnitrophus magneticus TaxID=1609969 RepID=A0A0F0CWD5_9BACT|nr:radical SAM protein [Candidatus Omnitrophus magneticus]
MTDARPYLNEDVLERHPCFSKTAHHKYGRIHLPVAPVCNIKCRYCTRLFDCVNESRPGVTSKLATPDEAVDKLERLVVREDFLSVVGIAGPGDPMANEATFETLKKVRAKFPDIMSCVSTNGLLLPERMDDLVDVGVKSLTVTINAVSPDVAQNIYSWIIWEGKRIEGKAAMDLLIANQWTGLKMAVDAGMSVKINTVLIPGINDGEMVKIASIGGSIGACLMNIIPLIPQSEFKDKQKPSREAIVTWQSICEPFIPQMTHCKQCRADAFGNLCEDKDMDLEVIYSILGQDYCDNVL